MAKKYLEEQYKEDRRVVNYIEKTGVNLQDISKDRVSKEYLLKIICEYKGLRIGSNGNTPFAPIDQCSDGKVSSAVNNRYNLAKKRLDEVKKGKRKITSLETTVEQLSLF